MRNKSRFLTSRTRGTGIVTCLLLGLGVALTARGDLDPTFDGNGLLSIRVGEPSSAAYAIVQQPDGKLVLAGQGTLNPADGQDFVAVRVTEDGSPDASFGHAGEANADFAGLDDIARAAVLQSDGKLVLAGYVGVGDDHTKAALARFKVDGSLDTTFGVGGWTTVNPGGSNDSATALIRQPDGRLVIAGSTDAGGVGRLLLARFNVNGTPDPTFGAGGTAVIDLCDATVSWGNGLALQPDGKYVVVGGCGRSAAVARLTPDGVLDQSFAVGGILLKGDSYGRSTQALAVAVQGDGAIVVAGGKDRILGLEPPSRGSYPTELLWRLNEDGSFDDSFISGGRFGAALTSIVVQDDGGLVVTRSSEFLIPFISRYTGLARFSSNGTLDMTFGSNGRALADFGERDIAPNSSGVALIRQADGKYVVVGPNDLGTFGAARFDDGAAFPGLVGLTRTSQRAGESEGEISYAVSRIGGMTGAVSVRYATTAALAQHGVDFENTAGTLTWADGDTSDRTITIPLVSDFTAEPDEDFQLVLSAPTGGAQLAASEATVTIEDDDVQGQSVLQFTTDEISATEATGVISIPVERVGYSTGAVSVNYSTTSGSAVAGTDFTATAGTLSWADGDASTRTIAVSVTNDTTYESRETFFVTLSDPSTGSAVGPLAIANITIDDDDTAGSGGNNGGSSGGGAGGGSSGGSSGSGGGGGGGAADWIALLLSGCLAVGRTRKGIHLRTSGPRAGEIQPRSRQRLSSAS